MEEHWTCARLRFFSLCVDGLTSVLSSHVYGHLEELEPEEDEIQKYVFDNMTFRDEEFVMFDMDKFAGMLLDKQQRELVHRMLDLFEGMDINLEDVAEGSQYANYQDGNFAYEYAQGGWRGAYGWHVLKNKYHFHTLWPITNFWWKVAGENQHREGGRGRLRSRDEFEADELM